VPAPFEPTPAQARVIAHDDGPLLVLGGAGTGKTRALVERFVGLASGEAGPEHVLALAAGPVAAESFREAVEARIGPDGSGELAVTTFQQLCARLLRDEALAAGVDPFAAPVTPGDRVAMLLDRIDELPLRLHDLRGNPGALLGSIVGRIDRLKAELISAGDYAAWAARLADDRDAEREREFGALYAAHDRMLAEAGALDTGDLVLHAFRLLREEPAVRARVATRYAAVLVDDLQDASFAQTLLLRLLASERAAVTAAADPAQAIHR
jgi:DNA helicase-2/ATP-dependent DNA helicase PcrA